jgi:hypothetical protein
MKKFIDYLTYCSFIGYIAFIPSGPFPIAIFGTKLDIFFGFVLLFCVLAKLTKITVYYPVAIAASLWIYVVTTFISVITSEEQMFSSIQWLISFGYILTCFLVPIKTFKHIKVFREILLYVAVFISLVLIYNASIFGLSNVQRIYLGIHLTGGMMYSAALDNYSQNIVDPNMTAVGLMMSILIYLPNFYANGYSQVRNIFSYLAFFIIVIGTIVTLSRTALISFIISCVLTALLLNFKSHKGVFKKIFNIIGILSIIAITLMGVYEFIPNIGDALIGRFIGSGVEQDEHRMSVMLESLDIFSKDAKNIWLGQGFFMTNPHNEILRYLSSSGLIGLLGFVSLICNVYFSLVIKTKKNYWLSFSSTSLYIFIILASQTYGHTKSLWASFMFSCIFYLEDKFNYQDEVKYSFDVHGRVA